MKNLTKEVIISALKKHNEENLQQKHRKSKQNEKNIFFKYLREGFLKTKKILGSGLFSIFHGKKITKDLFEKLEEQLLISDIGINTTQKIIANLMKIASRKQLRNAEGLYELLKEEMKSVLIKVEGSFCFKEKKPFVVLVVGVNGVGKTTTVGKLAYHFKQQGKTVMLAAGDTFRFSAIEQLQIWGQRNNVPVVSRLIGEDSASVIFDSLQVAKARAIDVLIADTAGRFQNQLHSMEELKKIVRVIKKQEENIPYEIILNIDAGTGQNAINQTKFFNEALQLTGIILTKFDGTAKGGVIFSIADQFSIPIYYIGVGERIEDLLPFNANDFIEELFSNDC